VPGNGGSRILRSLRVSGCVWLRGISLPALAYALTLSLAAVVVNGCGANTDATRTVAPPPLTITTTSLPNGQVGTAYSATLAATGGTTQYTWALTSGTLPAGLSLSAGAISGTPTAAANATPLTFTVTDSGNPAQVQSVSLTLTIAAMAPTTLAITTTTSLPNGQVGTAYSATLAATGGTTPYTWSLTSGNLPAGLLLTPATGTISGTPTASASASPLAFLVTDSGNPAQTKAVNLTLTIAPATLIITTTSLPSGQVGTAYTATLAATGGTTPYAWSLTSGTLPSGLSLNAGTVSGTPTASASASLLTFAATDSGNPAQTKTVSVTLTIAPATLAITTTSLPNGQVGTAYSATLAVTGGTTPYTWSLTSGTLPAGLLLTSATGTIGGTPTAFASATPLTFTATDSGNPAQNKTVNLTLTIAPATLAITTTSLPNGQAGTAYSATLAATGGTTPYSWSLTSGTLPTGLSLTPATGTIGGTPTATASATPLTFTVADSGNPAQNKTVSLTLTVAPATLVITTTSLPNGQVGTAYTASLAATSGTTPYTWALTSGTLPAGLSLTPSTGTISGTPTASASATPLTFSVADSGNPAQNKSVSLTLTITPATLIITTTSLPNGEVGTNYQLTLTATGGTAPYTWSLTSGALPANLSLNAATGGITGTPAATVSATPLTFTLTDSSNPAQNKAVNLTLTVVPSSGITASVSPVRAGITTTQTLSVTPTTNDTAGVNWSASGSACTGTACGTFSAASSLSGVAVTYTPPVTPGVYTITATSVSDNAIFASVTVGVTNLAGVFTYHNDLSRDGADTQEYALTTSNVTTATFGKLFSCSVDSSIYTQPLWVPNLTIAAAQHNAVFVATTNDSLYAFDADSNTTPCTPLWHANLLDAAHGGNPGEGPVPASLLGQGYGSIQPEVGVIGTPVIDPTTNTLYVVSKSVILSGPTFYQRLHAIDLTTGNEKFSGPVSISATYPGTGDGGTTTTFVAQQENQRPGLALANGVVYVVWASHEDKTPYYGWVIGYNASNLSQVSVYNDTPNAGQGGIWMSGGAPAVDSSGNLYLITGNGNFDVTSTTPPNNDYGDSFLELSSSLSVSQYFTPSDQLSDNNNDNDFGSGGATILVDLPANGANPTHLVIGGGKDGALYLLNRDRMGGLGDTNAWQRIALSSGIFSTGAFWNSTLYIATQYNPMQALALSASTATMTVLATTGPNAFVSPAPTPSVSSAPDYTNGIVWALDNSNYCTGGSLGCGPAVLYAYMATNLSNELWNSSQGTGNAAGNAVKFTVPTVANGKVYVPTRGNNTGGADGSTSVSGELDVYGLPPN